MAVEATWTITKLQCLDRVDSHANVVQTVYWKRKLVDDVYTAETDGACDVGAPTGEFVNYDDLTQDIVISWIVNILDVAGIDSVLQDNINTQKKPVVVVPPLPWANNTI